MDIEILKEQIQAYCKANCISGLLRVTVRDKVEFEQYLGFADDENKIPFSNKSMFTLYSISKAFCAIGLMKLVDRQHVNLESHPARYVPEAIGLDPAITIRQLLSHTSGLPDFLQIPEFVKKYAPGYSRFARQHITALADYPQYFAPGTSAKYANVNYLLCALIIENVSGTTYSDYMKDEVFKILGAESAVIDNEHLVIPQRVKAYELQNRIRCEVAKGHNWMFGAGDVVGTVDDVYCLNKAIKHKLLLSPDAWDQILTPSPLNSMGMGCTIYTWNGKHCIAHNGGHVGFRTLHLQLPEDDFDIIFLSNSGYGNARALISNMILTAFYGDDPAPALDIEMDKGYI